MPEYKVPIKGETKEEYARATDEYFGHGTTQRNLGVSADDKRTIEQHLPGQATEHAMAERYAKGFGKASRSGAFSKPTTGYAIFPNGLKFASDFIDEHTPGKYKKPENPWGTNTPIEQEERQEEAQQRRLAFVYVDECIDCGKLIDRTVENPDIVPNFGFIMQTNTHMLHAMGLQFGDPIATAYHFTCSEKVKQFKKLRMPLVRGGALLDKKDRDMLLKYKNILQIHDGQEVTVGHFKMAQRLERLAINTQDLIIKFRKSGQLEHFREDRRSS